MPWLNAFFLGGGIGVFIGVFIAMLLELSLAVALSRIVVWFIACGVLALLLHFLVHSFDD
ncbi:MAG: hypothetical protein HQM07_06595 [Zetaproteobacteria bacterium]|nr:hypothetical protein [Zetaproteobacteria bacterium]